MAGNAEELVIRVIGDDAQYTAVMKRVQRTIDKASGATNKFNRSNRAMGSQAGTTYRQIGLLDNAIRGSYSRSLTDVIRLMENNRLVMAALPIAATVAGFAILGSIVADAAKKFVELKKAGSDTARAFDQLNAGLLDSGNSLHEKLLSVEAEVDDLSNNHFAALQKRLELINDQRLDSLRAQLKDLGFEADSIFKKLQVSWYMPGIGSTGAQNAWTDFASKYHLLLSQKNSKGASNLLDSTLAQAKHVLALQQQSAASYSSVAGPTQGLYMPQRNAASLALHAYGVTDNSKDIQSQQALIDLLSALKGDESTTTAIAAGKTTLETLKASKRTKEALDKLIASLKQASEAIQRNQTEVAEASRSGLIMPHPLVGMYGQPSSDLRSVMPLDDLSKNSDATRSISSQSKYQAQWLTNLNQAAAIQKQNADAMEQVRLQIEQTTGTISAHDAAVKLASIHTAEYTEQIEDLFEQLDNVKKLRDSGSISNAEYSARSTSLLNQMGTLNGQRQVQYAQDQQGIYGSTVSGATRDALSQMVQSWTDMSKQIPDLITSSLDEVNRSLASSLMAKTYNGRDYRRGIENALGSTARGIGTHLLNAGFQNIEGSALKKLFGIGGKPDGTASNPIYTKSADGIGKAGSIFSGDSLSHLFGSMGHGFGKAGSWFGSLLSAIPHFAGGGDFLANRPMLVGEQGPEIVSFGAPGHVTPNRSISSGDTNHLYIDARGSSDPASVHAAVMRAMGAYMPMMPGVAVHSIKNENSRVPSRKRI